MKFLIDNNLSPSLSKMLTDSGHNSVHVKEIGMKSASDLEIFEYAFKEKKSVVTADTDFSFILSRWNHSLPSVLLFRFFPYRPEIQFAVLSNIVTRYEVELSQGSLILIEPDRVRIRMLPLL